MIKESNLSITEKTTETSTTSSTDDCSKSSITSTTVSEKTETTTPVSTCQKWLTKKCFLYKYKRNGSHLILEEKVFVDNTDLCDRIDKNFKKSAIEKLNKEKAENIEKNKNETLAEIERINKKYESEILTNKSFSYVAIVFIALLFTLVILMDITKIKLFKKNFSTFDRKTNNQVTTVDDLTYKKVRYLNQEISKKMNYKSVKNN